MALKLIGSSYSKVAGIRERLVNSFLELKYFKDKGGSFNRRYLPFLGDVSISESRKANYVSYTPLSRNSSLPYYLGSESRYFKVTYEMSPNFLLQNPGFIDFIKSIPAYSDAITQGAQALITDFLTPNNNNPPFSRKYGADLLGRKKEYVLFNEDLPDEKLIYNFIDYQINLIRSSVINNAVSPTQGPPIIRLNHGLLYQNVPCICTEYSLDQQYDDSNKKDFHVTYKVSKFKVVLTFTLQEIRTGNFLDSDFQPFTDGQDNIVGWEQLFNAKTGGFDPINPIYKD